MNVELLEKVKAAILKDPGSFNMSDWDCGTTACIAGHVMRLNGQSMHCSLINSGHVARLLGLDKLQAEALFYVGGWPTKFQEAYGKASDRQDNVRMAAVAAERIDHFIKTKGRE